MKKTIKKTEYTKSSKKRRPVKGSYIAWFIVAACLVFSVSLLLLPALFQRVIDHVLQQAESGQYISVTVRHAGLFGAGLGPASFGGHTKGRLTVETADISYTLASLFQKKIKSLTISGASIPMVLQPDGSFSVPFIPETGSGSEKSKSSGFSVVALMDYMDQLSVSGEFLLTYGDGKTVSLPFSIHSDESMASLVGTLEVMGNTVSVRADKKQEGIRVIITAPEIGVSQISPFFNNNNIHGQFGMDAVLFVDTLTGNVSTWNADITAKKFGSAGILEIQHGRMSIEGKAAAIRFQGSVDLSTPHVDTAGFSFTGSYSPHGAMKVRGTGAITAMAGPIMVKAQVPLHCQGYGKSVDAWHGTCQETKQGTITFHHKAADQDAMEKIGKTFLSRLRLQGKGGQHPFIKGDIDLTSFSFYTPHQSVEAKKIQLYTEFTKRGIKKLVLMRANISRFSAKNEELAIHGSLRARSHSTVVHGEGFTTQGRLVIDKGDIEGRKKSVHMQDVSVSIPFSWPWNKEKKADGTIQAKKIYFMNRDLGSMEMNVSMMPRGLSVEGRHKNSDFNELGANFSGKVTIDETLTPKSEITFSLSDIFVDTEKTAHPFSKEIAFQGFVGSSGNLSITRTEKKGEGTIRVREGVFSAKNQEVTVSGIKTEFMFKDIVRRISFPAQRLNFDKILAGKIETGPGEIVFQSEGAEQLFIEQGSVKWAGGALHTKPLRISVPAKNIQTTIYCDRIHVAEMLRVLGSAAVEGSGEVSGIVPVQYARGGISFKDGYLYSKPGIGGRIRLQNAGDLMQGIPGSRAGQVDFVLAALKDFSYDWIRFTINSDLQEDAAKIKMEVYGHPTSPLPFIYQNGAFMRVEGAPGIQRPIQLTLNFTLPLNALISSLKGVQKLKDTLQ